MCIVTLKQKNQLTLFPSLDQNLHYATMVNGFNYLHVFMMFHCSVRFSYCQHQIQK